MLKKLLALFIFIIGIFSAQSALAAQAPSIDVLYVYPTAVNPGTPNVIIHWESSNTTSCNISGGNMSGTYGANGGMYMPGTLNSTTSFSVACTGPSGTVSSSVTLTVDNGLPPTLSSFTPEGGITANSASVSMTYSDPSGVASTLYCIVSNGQCVPNTAFTNGGSVSTAISGSFTVCSKATDAAGNSSGDYNNCHYYTRNSVPPTVTAPTITTTSITIKYVDNSDEETSYQMYKNGVYQATVSGLAGTGQYDFYSFNGLTCGTTYTFGVVEYRATVNSAETDISVTTSACPVSPTVNISASPTSVAYGGSTTITWSSSNATSCNANASWSGAKALSGNEVRSNLTSNSSYYLTCTGPAGNTTSHVDVAVASAPSLSLSSSGPVNIGENSSGNSTVTTTSSNVSGITYSRPPIILSGQFNSVDFINPTLSVTTDSNSTSGIVQVIATGNSGTITSSVNIPVIVAPAGSISVSPSTCIIPAGLNSCNTTVTWSTRNPVVTSAVTASGMTDVIANSGSQSMVVPYNYRRFYLYNNSIQLNYADAFASCTSGTVWDNTNQKCALPPTVVSPSSSSVTSNSATISASVSSDGGGVISDRGFCYAAGSGGVNPIKAWATCVSVAGTTGSMSKSLTGLSQGTTYHYSAYATNVAGTVYTYPPDNSFTTSVMSGNLAPTLGVYSCVISSGSSNCSLGLDWNTTNPQATSAVTSPTNSSGNSVATTIKTINADSDVAVTIPYGYRDFYLYNNSITLVGPVRITANCNTPTYYWTGASCALTPVMSGTLTASPTSCAISTGNSSCNVNISWNTVNPEGSSAVTASGMTSVNQNSGSQAMAVPNGGRTFYLYNNAKMLAQAAVTASCASGNYWDTATSKCVLNPVMAGTLTTSASTCTISAGSDNCSVNVSWNTTSPEATSAVTASGMTNVVGNSGSQAMAVPRGGRTFFLYNNGKSLVPTSPSGAGVAVNADCNTPIDYWNTSTLKCAVNTYTITASSGANGTVTPVGVTTKNYGTNQTYTITPSTNYYIVSVLVDGVSVGAVGTYTFSNITANHTISATFAASACANGAPDYPNCTTVSASTPYTNYPSTNVSFTYATTTNTTSPECRLLDNLSSPLTAYTSSSPIIHTAPSGVGSYAYYVQCRNATTPSITINSNQIIVNVVATPVMVGSLNSSLNPCTIVSGANSCVVDLTWTTTNSEVTPSSVTSSYPSANTQVSVPNANNGTATNITIPYPSRTFYLFNNAKSLVPTSPPGAGLTVAANCVGGTSWNGTSCAVFPPTANLTASPATIVKGATSTLTWSSTNASSCVGTGFNTSNSTSGTVAVSPTVTTTYSLVCTGSSSQASDSKTVSVTVTTKKPGYKER